MMKLMVSNGARQVDVLGFSAGSYTGLAVHSVLSDFACFPGDTKVAAIAAPPELMRLATGERKVTLIQKTGYACGVLLIQKNLGITSSS